MKGTTPGPPAVPVRGIGTARPGGGGATAGGRAPAAAPGLGEGVPTTATAGRATGLGVAAACEGAGAAERGAAGAGLAAPLEGTRMSRRTCAQEVRRQAAGAGLAGVGLGFGDPMVAGEERYQTGAGAGTQHVQSGTCPGPEAHVPSWLLPPHLLCLPVVAAFRQPRPPRHLGQHKLVQPEGEKQARGGKWFRA